MNVSLKNDCTSFHSLLSLRLVIFAFKVFYSFHFDDLLKKANWPGRKDGGCWTTPAHGIGVSK